VTDFLGNSMGKQEVITLHSLPRLKRALSLPLTLPLTLTPNPNQLTLNGLTGLKPAVSTDAGLKVHRPTATTLTPDPDPDPSPNPNHFQLSVLITGFTLFALGTIKSTFGAGE